MTDVRHLPRLRPAGLLEKYSTTRHALGIYNNVACTAVYANPASSSALEPIIYRAMQLMIDRHPALSAIPVDEDNPSAYFVRIQTIALPSVIKVTEKVDLFGDDSQIKSLELDSFLEAQHNDGFQGNHGHSPFWRLIILKQPNQSSRFAASFVYHHALGDGLSGLAFQRTFQSALNVAAIEAARGNDAKMASRTVTSPDQPMLPTLENLHPLPISIWHLLKALWNEYFPQRLGVLWAGNAINLHPPERRVRIRTVSISSGTVGKLVAASRDHRTSLTGTLETLLSAAIFANLPQEQCMVLHAAGTLSFRRYLPIDTIDEDSIGTWVSGYSHIHQRDLASAGDKGKDKMSFFNWEDAKGVKKSIENELGKEGKDCDVALLRWAGDLKQFFEKKDGRPRECSFECSNLGSFKPAEKQADGGWSVGRIVFSQDCNPIGPAFCASLVTGADGCLSVAFSFLDDAVDVALMERVIGSFKAGAEQLAS